jgi:hypothetical protein
LEKQWIGKRNNLEKSDYEPNGNDGSTHLGDTDGRPRSIVRTNAQLFPQVAQVFYITDLRDSMISKLIREHFVVFIRHEGAFLISRGARFLQIQAFFVDGVCARQFVDPWVDAQIFS